MLDQIKNFAVENVDANQSDSYQDPELYDGTTVNPWISVMGEHADQGIRVILNCHEDHAEEVAARLNSWPRLQEQVKLLREALGELLDPPQGTDIRDRITKGRFALEATKEGA